MRGFFGIGIYHPKTIENTGTLWRSAYSFGAAYTFTIGPRFTRQSSDTPKAWKSIPMFNYPSFDEFCRLLPHSCPLVGIELDERARPLASFVHPERVCYLLGAEDHGLPEAVRQQCHALIQIPGLRICLNVSTTGSIVLYDRLTKGGK